VIKILISHPNTQPFILTSAHYNFLRMFSQGTSGLADLLETEEYSLEYDMQGGFPLDRNRNASCRVAIAEDVDYWITLDSDMAYPDNLFWGLLRPLVTGGAEYDVELGETKHVNPEQVDIVSGLYFRRGAPFTPVSGVLTRTDHPAWHHPINTDWMGLVKTDIVGAGCLAVRGSALKKIGDPWFKYEKWFDGSESSEDIFFGLQAKNRGLGVWTDTRIPCAHFYVNQSTTEQWKETREKYFDAKGVPKEIFVDPAIRPMFNRDLKKPWPGSRPV
jgi:hypothetical protein